MKKFIFTMGLTALMSGAALNAQVTIGKDKSPETFSVLELISNNTRGLRLPQMSNTEKATAFSANNNILIAAGINAEGLQIFNTTTICVETWNGTAWILTCAPIFVTYNANGGNESDISVETENSYITGNSYIVENNTFTKSGHFFSGWNTAADGTGDSYAPGDPIDLVTDLTLYAQWAAIPAPNATTPLENTYVGAFWKNNQTGERLIRISIGSSGNTGNWSAIVVDGDFIKMDTSPTTDPNVDWTDNNTPADMNDPANDAAHQVSGNATFVQGSVNANEHIYFRIGLTSAIPSGSDPRYGRIILRYNNNTKSQFLYIRQGEEADYVFRQDDYATGDYIDKRILAAKFSPYNLTNTAITESTTAGIATGVATTPATYKGAFVDYPTQAGAFFQWGMNDNITFAYHPTKPAGSVNDWSTNYSSNYWNSIQGTQETCPFGWRRPTVGDITSGHSSQAASGSELMQSLFYTTFDVSGVNASNAHSTNYRYWGYYADGYFDRRAIVTSVGTNPLSNSAVSVNTKDVAYVGVLYTNPASGASLFMPVAGYRDYNNGTLNYSGSSGYYWSSSAGSTTDGCWGLTFASNYASQSNANRSYGFAVRCVK